MTPCPFRSPAALPRSRRRITLASDLRFSSSWACRASSLVAGPCTTWLTWMRGLMTISAEGGPERKQYGP